MRKLLVFILPILAGSAILQVILIFFKHYTGFERIEGALHIIVSLAASTLVTAFVAAVAIQVDRLIIRRFDSRLPWQSGVPARLVLEIPATLATGAIIGALLSLLWGALHGYAEPMPDILVYNCLIAATGNIIIMAVLESILLFRDRQQSLLKMEKLERENVRMRFETLKKQLDPHFLFNSLNVLSSLIRRDGKKAEEFIDKFSSIYRYTLDVIDKPVVTVGDELEFARSYLFLQKVRFDDGIILTMEVTDGCRDMFVPPLAVQTLLENAIKHNIAAREQPLEIRISSGDDALLVANTMRPKQERARGGGLGLENLKKRYALISGKIPRITSDGQEFRVQLPFIEPD